MQNKYKIFYLILIFLILFFIKIIKNFNKIGKKLNKILENLTKSVIKFNQKIDQEILQNDITNIDEIKTELNQKILLDDIAGIDEVKTEVKEIISFLKEPEKYKIMGAKIPKGILLVGPPGIGKTLLVKAIANEANVSFYSIEGSKFMNQFIGIGASRIRSLFKEALENTPCIIFIDEIDTIGCKRKNYYQGYGEDDQNLNQLLIEMDGFKKNNEIIIFGATNRLDMLDNALLRSGRFDQYLQIQLPNYLNRLNILNIHIKNKFFDKKISLRQLAHRTRGFSGADLANLLNEAAIRTTRYKKKIITNNEINETLNRMINGINYNKIDNTKTKKLTAYREIGRAFIGSILKNHNKVTKITLIPCYETKNLTFFEPNENEIFITRVQLLACITTILAGYLVEKIIFGATEITLITNKDLQYATHLAKHMVTRLGMSNMGPIYVGNINNEQKFLNIESKNSLKNRIDKEIHIIINYCKQIGTDIILDNRVLIDLAVEKLLETEIIEGFEFRNLIKQYTIFPQKGY